MKLMGTTKAELRQIAKEKLEEIFADKSAFYSRQNRLIEKLELSPEFRRAKTILSYYPMAAEFDLMSLIISNPDKQWVLPRPIGKGIMLLFEVYNLHDLVTSTQYRILVPPATNTLIKPEQLDLVIIPGLAFDKNNYRLGRGAGYYDRLLEKLKKDCVSLGVVAEELLLGELPVEQHDKKMTKILSV